MTLREVLATIRDRSRASFLRDLLAEMRAVEGRSAGDRDKALRSLRLLAISHRDYGVAAAIDRAIERMG